MSLEMPPAAPPQKPFFSVAKANESFFVLVASAESTVLPKDSVSDLKVSYRAKFKPICGVMPTTAAVRPA